MIHYLKKIRDEIVDFFRSVKLFFSGASLKSRGYIKHLFRTLPRSKPIKVWCFYPDPYRKGLVATGIAGVGALTVIAIILLIIAIITFVVLLAAGVIYVFGAALALAVAAGGGWVGEKINSDNGGVVGGIGGLLVGGTMAGSVFSFGSNVWASGLAFAENLNVFFVVTNFIGQTWLLILGVVVAPAIAVFTIALLTLTAIFLLRGVEKGILLAYGIRNPCPECSQNTEPAIYYCNNCSQRHPLPLIPSQYGVFSHQCAHCDEKMPTMLLQGRNKTLPHKCRHCETDLFQKEAGTDKHVAFVGGQKTGKTCLMVQLTKYLLDHGATIPEEGQQKEFLRLQQLMERGETPPKTNPVNIYRAFQLMLKNGRFPYHLHFYDLAGEKFEDAKDAAAHRFFTTLDSVVFLLDPYGIPEFCQSNSIPLGLEYKSYDPLELVRNLSQVLERYNEKAKVKKINFNLVLVKMDTGYFSHESALAFNQDLIRTQLKAFISEALGQAALIHHIEQHFGKVNYHIVSALGRIPAATVASPFVPQNLENVFGKVFDEIKVRFSSR